MQVSLSSNSYHLFQCLTKRYWDSSIHEQGYYKRKPTLKSQIKVRGKDQLATAQMSWMETSLN